MLKKQLMLIFFFIFCFSKEIFSFDEELVLVFCLNSVFVLLIFFFSDLMDSFLKEHLNSIKVKFKTCITTRKFYLVKEYNLFNNLLQSLKFPLILYFYDRNINASFFSFDYVFRKNYLNLLPLEILVTFAKREDFFFKQSFIERTYVFSDNFNEILFNIDENIRQKKQYSEVFPILNYNK